jgi:hypothetical protein
VAQILSSVRFFDGIYQGFRPNEGWQAICDGGAPSRRLLHGWQPIGLYYGFSPIVLLELRHDSGREATWILDRSLNRIGGGFDEVPAEARATIETLAVPALQHLCRTLLTGTPGTDPIDPLGLHALNLTTILGLIVLAGERVVPPPIAIDLRSIPLDQEEIVLHGSRLSVAALRACVAPVMQEQHMAVLAGAAYGAICPFTDTPLETRTTLLDDRLSACRFESPGSADVPGPIFYLCNTAGIAARELFIPVLNCTVAMHVSQLGSQLFPRLLSAAVKHADLLPGYLAKPKSPVSILTAYPGLHIGHVLWNELSGLDRIRRELSPADLPQIIVPNPEFGTEVYGPIECIFPEFIGKVRRLPANTISGVVYRDGLTAMHVYDSRVSRHLAARVGRVAQDDPVCQRDHDHLASFQAERRAVILIGLRVQNRTMPDQVRLWYDVIEHLCHRLGPIAVVVDGINARLDADPSTDYGVMSPQTGRPPVLDELEIVIALRRHFRGDMVRIINTVAAPMARSLFWAQHALFFVAFWGAGLAKYRWVANRPGLVLTNRANLEIPEGDLRIYHSQETMEAPTPLDFIGPEYVTDLPIQVGSDYRAGFFNNFVVEHRGVTAALDRLIDRVVQN